MRVLSLTLSIVILAYSHACTLDGVTVTGTCTLSSIMSKSGCTDTDLDVLLGKDYDDQIFKACHEARTLADEDMLPWDAVTKRGFQFDKEFFNGGTIFNTETDSTDFVKDTKRLAQIRDELLPKHGIKWPSNIDNFKNCEAQAAMCCWVSSREPTMKGEPEDNTDVCSHDMTNSPTSAHVEGGETVFTGDGEGAVNCHGFYWNEGERYKGNLLFRVAMSHGLLGNKYVRNIPGAPMCGCVEQMPVVTHSDCTTVEVSETYLLSYDSEELDLSIKMTGDPEVTFVKCAGDGSLTDGHSTEGHPGDLEKYVTGKEDCGKEEYDALEAMSYKHQAADEQWVSVAGKGFLYQPSLSMTEFNEVFAKSPNQIIRRRCFECDHTHKDIYYRRYDANGVPAGLDILKIMKNYWHDIEGNKFHEDFELYSTYDDALNNRNPWLFCNFNDRNVGFPRDCGPERAIWNQWNAFVPLNGHHHGRYHVGFYVEAEGNKVGVARSE